MANLEFYAVDDDIETLSEFLLANGFIVYESESRLDCKLRTFSTANEIVIAYREVENRKLSPFFQISCYHSSFAGKVVIEKTKLIPDVSNGHTFRYSVGGWGLLHLQFGGITGSRTITPSCFTHNSEKRAHNWDDAYKELGKASEWDWHAISRSSRLIQSYIGKKLAACREGTRPVLIQAAQLSELEGLKLEKVFLT